MRAHGRGGSLLIVRRGEAVAGVDHPSDAYAVRRRFPRCRESSRQAPAGAQSAAWQDAFREAVDAIAG
jgi:hypothetical protein